MPSTVKSCAAFSFWKLSRAGASVLQGAHHEAQKLTSTHLPR